MRLLKERGARLSFNDPFNDRIELDGTVHRSVPLTPASLARHDLVTIITDHSSYDYPMVVRHAKVILDTRNATRDVKTGRAKIYKL